MCGIAGFFNTDVEQQIVDTVKAKLQHRGPDAEGYYYQKGIGLIHARLSIIELSPLGSQPYRFENLVLIFNGELYNYKEVREDLKKEGYTFLSNSDTEVLIKAFHCWGPTCLNRFIGMFAFCIYDEEANEVFLARDRVGVKPLYYSYQHGVLFFASELKALLSFPVSREIDQDATSQYFRFGFVPGHLSIFKSISKLAPGHYVRFNSKASQHVKYWQLPPSTEKIVRSEQEYIEELEALLISAFKYRMVSDVPVGVFLSGGIDSSLLTAILQKHNGNIHTFTIGFNEARFDESGFARQVSQHVGTQHLEETLSVELARQQLSQFYEMYDEPFADTSGLPTSLVSSLARKCGMKVVLSADGGDELFGGYTHYQKATKLFHQLKRIPTSVRHGLSGMSSICFPKALRKNISVLNLEHKAYAFEELLDADNPVKFFEAYVANQAWEEIFEILNYKKSHAVLNVDTMQPTEAMMEWDFRYYLPDDLLVKIDRATMFHSLECREPFLDHRLTEFSRRLPMEYKIRNGQGKYLLKKVLERYLPLSLFERKKRGFSIPIFEWFSNDLDALFKIHLSEESIKEIPLLNSKGIQHEYNKYHYFKKHGKEYNIEKMWRILSFVMWWKKYSQ